MEKVIKKITYEFNNEEYELQDSIYMNTEGNERLSALINKNRDKVILIDKNDNILFEVKNNSRSYRRINTWCIKYLFISCSEII